MKKNLVLAGIIISTVILAVLSVVTAIRIKNLGTEPVAPSAPKSKPKAEEVIPLITPAAGCRMTFGVATPTPTATPTPCPVKIQGRVYRDRSEQADYRVSDSEEFGPVVFRVDYQPEGASMITSGGNKVCTDSCTPSCAANFANGTFSTGSLTAGKYAVRVNLSSADWVVTEAYLANGTACKANKAGNITVSGLNTQIAYVSLTNYSCGTFNLWFGVKPKGEATPTPTPTGTVGPTLTPTTTPAATATPVPPTNTPPPGGESYCDFLRADKTAGSASLPVNFTGKGYDTTRVKGFRFAYGDGKSQEFLGSFNSDHVQPASHTYDKVGTYQAILEILDNGDHWKTRNECKVTITVSGFAQGPTVTPVYRAAVEPTPTEALLPEAGLKIPTFGGLIMGFLLISLGVALIF